MKIQYGNPLPLPVTITMSQRELEIIHSLLPVISYIEVRQLQDGTIPSAKKQVVEAVNSFNKAYELFKGGTQ